MDGPFFLFVNRSSSLLSIVSIPTPNNMLLLFFFLWWLLFLNISQMPSILVITSYYWELNPSQPWLVIDAISFSVFRIWYCVFTHLSLRLTWVSQPKIISTSNTCQNTVDCCTYNVCSTIPNCISHANVRCHVYIIIYYQWIILKGLIFL